MKKNIASSLLLLMGMLSCFGVFLFLPFLGSDSLAAVSACASARIACILPAFTASEKEKHPFIKWTFGFGRYTQLSCTAGGRTYRL